MTDSSNPDEIRADIERTRAELSRNVDTLGDTVNPKNIATRQVDRVKDRARNLRDSIMGSPDDPYDQGRAGELQSAVSDKASGRRRRRQRAAAGPAEDPRQPVGRRADRVFGVGLLVSSLIPASRKEQQAVGKLQDNLEPLKQQVGDVAKEMADNLREPAQQAVESIKSVAADGAANVKGEAQSAKDDVAAQAQGSKDAVQDAQSH